MTTILLIALLSTNILPTNSYEMGHYAPGVISFTLGNYATQVAYDIFWGGADANKRDWVSYGVGVATSVVTFALLRNHYETYNTESWYHLGLGHAMLGQMTINLIRIPIHRRNKEKAIATIQSWGYEEIKRE